MRYSVYRKKPENFVPTIQVAGCFCEWEGRILLLKRHPQKPQGETWGLPAGKLESGETAEQAAIREVAEEVGLDIRERLQTVGELYIQLGQVHYAFFMFYKRFDHEPHIALETDAHDEARWVTIDEALKLPLIVGGSDVFAIFREWKSRV